MPYAYAIKSLNHDYSYKGHCNNLESRLHEHNSGKTISIRPYLPFEIVYFEWSKRTLKQLSWNDISKWQQVENF